MINNFLILHRFIQILRVIDVTHHHSLVISLPPGLPDIHESYLVASLGEFISYMATQKAGGSCHKYTITHFLDCLKDLRTPDTPYLPVPLSLLLQFVGTSTHSPVRSPSLSSALPGRHPGRLPLK